MNVKRIDFGTHILSIGTTGPHPKPIVRSEYLENPLLNIYHPIQGNPVVEDLMDKVVSKRSVPLDDGIETLRAIKENKPFMTEYIDRKSVV